MKKILKVGFINIAILLVFMELGGQLLKKRHESELEGVYGPREKAYTDYLQYVNHFRDLNYSKATFEGRIVPYSILPSNFGKASELLYSCYGENCDNSRKSYDLLIQGDSWAEGLDKNIASLLNYIPAKINIISAGTTSFSPSNMEAQLGYLKDKGFKFKSILVVIDQTDIGDEYFRYKTKTIPSRSNIKSSRVMPFNLLEHKEFYNYSLYTSGTAYLSYKVTLKLFGHNVPSMKLILSPLRGKSPLAVNYFKTRLSSYINYLINACNDATIIILTHDHRRHLTGEYVVSTEEIVSEVIESLPAISKRIKHVHITPRADGLCIKEDCSDYYVEGDEASHPRPSSYRKIINKLAKVVSDSIVN